jgi:hypothetical protein
MKRISLIRRRRYLYRAVMLGFAAAAFVPSTALAAYDVGGAEAAVDPYLAGSVSAEDAHGMSAANGAVLPAGERKALEEQYARSVYQKPVNVAPPSYLTAPTVTAGAGVDWSQVALWASVGLVGILGAVAVAFTTRRGVRAAHT